MMDSKLRYLIVGLLLVGGALSAYWTQKPVESLPTPAASTSIPATQTSATPSPSEVSPSGEAANGDAAAEAAKENFHELTKRAKQSIPTQQDLQKLTAKEVHFTPESMQRAAGGIAEVADAISKDGNLAPEGLQFYRDCAEKDTNPIAIRASCYLNHERLLKKNQVQGESLENDPKVSDRIKNLVKTL